MLRTAITEPAEQLRRAGPGRRVLLGVEDRGRVPDDKVEDAAGNAFAFKNSHTLQPGDYVRLRGGRGTDSDAKNVVHRQNCNFIRHNDKDTTYFHKPFGARADVHACTRTADDRDGSGYVIHHG